MSTPKQRRPRISKGILIASSDDTVHNAIKGFKRFKISIVRTYNSISYEGVNRQLIQL